MAAFDYDHRAVLGVLCQERLKLLIHLLGFIPQWNGPRFPSHDVKIHLKDHGLVWDLLNMNRIWLKIYHIISYYSYSYDISFIGFIFCFRWHFTSSLPLLKDLSPQDADSIGARQLRCRTHGCRMDLFCRYPEGQPQHLQESWCHMIAYDFMNL